MATFKFWWPQVRLCIFTFKLDMNIKRSLTLFLILTSATLAWGVNLPAHFVIVKGTEYFDGKESRYVDYPVTDVLQMMGRAGRPQFDTKGVSLVMVEEGKKNFYKKFLYDPFPVESCLAPRLAGTLNAEIAIGTVSSIEDCLGYLDWTFFARRCKMNPSFYGAKSSDEVDIVDFLHKTVLDCVEELKEARCVSSDDDGINLAPTHLGVIASKYYLNPKTPHQMEEGCKETRKLIKELYLLFASECENVDNIDRNMRALKFPDQVEEIAVASILYFLSRTTEFSEIPVRHNEELLNADLSESLPWGPKVPLVGNIMIRADQDYDVDIMAEPFTK
jgi:replicative superfamily II helicase